MALLPTKDFNSELVIGLVGAVGTELDVVIKFLKERLGLAGYHAHVIKISQDIFPAMAVIPKANADHFNRISALMDGGNQIRANAVKQFRENSIDSANEEAFRLGNSVLAFGAAARIFEIRTEEGKVDPKQLEKTVFIVDSLKRPEEVELLRLTYPGGFVLVGVHAEEDRRLAHLMNNLGMPEDLAKQLVERDGQESQNDCGQRVNKTFHLADFFVKATAEQDHLRFDIQRMVEVLFGNPFVTPTFDEYAMFMAFAAALRSADLSRQVGAVVARNFEILSTGANDCPRSGGGLYWPERSANGHIDDHPDGRDYQRGIDSNRFEQLEMIRQMMNQLEENPGLKHQANEFEEILQKSRIKDLIEFGRVVHAEMEALLACGRNGISTLGATLFCTTFPCHNCAKHLVAAGLERVVYVEPYPKSKALKFHSDSIVNDSNPHSSSSNRLTFEPFAGIGPRRFFDLFSMRLSSGYDLTRKDAESGKKQDWCIETSRLRLQMNPASYLQLEAQCREIFARIQIRTSP